MNESWSKRKWIRKCKENELMVRRIWMGKRNLIHGSIYEAILFSNDEPEKIDDYGINLVFQDSAEIAIYFRDLSTLMKCLDECECPFTAPLIVTNTDEDYNIIHIFEANESGFNISLDYGVAPCVHVPKHHVPWLIEMLTPFEQMYGYICHCFNNVSTENRLHETLHWYYCFKMESRKYLLDSCVCEVMKEGISDQDVKKLISLGNFVGVKPSFLTTTKILSNIARGLESKPPKGKNEMYNLVRLFITHSCFGFRVKQGELIDTNKVFE